MTARDRMKEIVDQQSDDATYEEIMRALLLERVVERGLADVRAGRTVSHGEIGRRIRLWTRRPES